MSRTYSVFRMALHENDMKEKLIRNVKKEVKQIMEEAVTRKFVHEESSSITSLCGAVEACLSQGLRRRALGLFKTSSTTALLHKVGKTYEPASVISRKIQEIENADPNRRSSSSGDSTNRLQTKPPLQKKNSTGTLPGPKYLWIRIALFEKQLAKIIDHLVQNSTKYYEKDSLVADPGYGSILSSLLVGPCALDYSKTKTQDHFWTDPPADELVQRHRISSGHPTPPSCRRPAFNFRRSLHAASSEEGHRQLPLSAKDYVESLHQNSRATLLYGKNNVLVLPKDLTESMPGYLSLHQTAQSLTIKWTPNQLMNGYIESEVQDKRRVSLPGERQVTRPPYRRATSHIQLFLYWDYAMNVRVDEVVYVHCHQQADSGGTIVLVGQDGVQQSPIHFPKGGHLLSFLSCLETGLLPHGQLDPPLWSQRGKGKVFPKLRRKGRTVSPLPKDESDEESTDFVFRIVNKSRHEEFLAGHELLDPSWTSHLQSRVRAHLVSTSTASSTSSSKSLSVDPSTGSGNDLPDSPCASPRQAASNHVVPKLTTGDSIQLVCDTMKRQIISRAFYGWLAYCRHLTTVRTHLSGLVNQNMVAIDDPKDASQGLSKSVWLELNDGGKINDKEEVFRLTYYGGVCHEIRKEVWPYLLGHYQFGSTHEERHELDLLTRQNYETTMSEWLAVEAIVRQRDKETMAANLAKLSSESTSGDVPPPTPALVQELSNDVFEDNVSLASDNDLDKDEIDYDRLKCNENQENKINYNGETEIIYDHNSCKKSKNTLTKDGDLEAENGDEGVKEEKSVIIMNGDHKDFSTFNGSEVSSAKVIDNYTNIEHTYENENMLTNRDIQETSGEVCKVNKSSSPDEGVDEDEDEDSENSREPNHIYNVQLLEKSVLESSLNGTRVKSSAAVIVTTNPSVDSGNQSEPYVEDAAEALLTPPEEEKEGLDTLNVVEDTVEGNSQGSRSTCVSPVSSQGGVYSMELLETFGLNLHRIDKDVQRCDRNYWYFTSENLEKLRNVMCTYVWEHLDIGYMQGMCDLVAPLLVIFDDEGTTYSCFCHLMERMGANFPNGGAMDTHFANMRSLIQILDSEMFELMHQNGDYTHFYFCYRWFLLDFKRELLYEDVFCVWETIWAAKYVASGHFVLFISLALVESYRDIILSNSMDFTDIIKFFNEMAERHDAKVILSLARDLVLQLQTLIENK